MARTRRKPIPPIRIRDSGAPKLRPRISISSRYDYKVAKVPGQLSDLLSQSGKFPLDPVKSWFLVSALCMITPLVAVRYFPG